jgi:uncharacterized protein (TIGR02594 family)
MDYIWSLAGQVGIWILNTFIADLARRATLTASFNAFIAERQSRADATVEIKNNLDAQDADLDKIKEQLKKPKESAVAKKFALQPVESTPWLSLAKKFVGQSEVLGARDNQWILDLFKHCTYHAAHDEIAWCAAFICSMLEQVGYKSTRSAAADSYRKYGTECELKPGAIVVFHWPAGGHHVSICDHVVNNSLVACLGGNQGNMVKLSTFNRASIVAVRWPTK